MYYEKERKHFLDVFKGCFIIFVVITHFGWSEAQRNLLLFPFWIDMAVPGFMIISGYVYFLSFSKNRITFASSAYKTSFIIPKIVRYTVPFLMAMSVDFICRLFRGRLSLDFVACILRGGHGPGSYYYPIMIQFLFVYPVVFFLIKENGEKGLSICFSIYALFEIFQRLYFLNGDCYRLLVLRYFFLIAFGSYLASIDNVSSVQNKYVVLGVLSFIIGCVLIYWACYAQYKPEVVMYWISSSTLASLYFPPIISFLFLKLRNIRFYILEVIGKASFNIFLTQMIYFSYNGRIHLKIFGSIQNLMLTIFLENIFNLFCCISIGLLFYKLSTQITGFILVKLKSFMK